MYSFNHRVIVNNYGTLQLGAVVNTAKKKNRRVYDVMLENGSTLSYVPVDTKGRKVQIDSNLTKKFADRIISNIDVLKKGNVRI